MSARAGIAIALACSVIGGAARADEPAVCDKPEHGSAEECERVATYRPDLSETVIPNNWMHATIRGFAHFTYNAHGSFREVPGGGLLLGVAPLHSQVLRLSAGLDFAVAPRPDDARQEVSIEPRLRVSAGNIDILGAVFMDFYATGVMPYWTGLPRLGGGGGGGISLRALNLITGEIGYEAVWDPGMAAPASPLTHRVTVLFGLDVVSLVLPWHNRVAKPTRRQAQIDLRCALLARADAERQKAATAPSAAAPSYCADVMNALADDEVQDGERATTAFFRHLSAKQPALSERLAREDDRLEGCRQSVMRQQRRCVDCTGAIMAEWPAYVMDPHQIAEALGCIPRPDGARLVCDAREAKEAETFAAKCGR